MEFSKIKVQEVLTCKLDESAVEIARKLEEKKDRRIFVVNEDNELQGIITTTDLVYKVLGKEDLNLKAEDIMTKDIKHVEVSEDLDKALEVMNDTKSFVCPG